MWAYYITFRIADRTVNGATHDDRRLSLIENARKANAGYWEDTTSFMLVESNLNTPTFAAQVCAGLSKEYDMVVVIDPSDKSASYFGAVRELDVLKSFFPGLKKVP